MSAKAAQLRITGYVQGVGYRDFCRRRAIELGLKGWVRNLPDHSVSALVEGEESAIVQLITLLKRGPTAARVEDVAVSWLAPRGTFVSFDVTY